MMLQTQAHQSDINSVAFADELSSQVLLSGSDDKICKLWDRRVLGNKAHPKPVGLFVGHAEGIAFVSSKGDCRHFLSNSKDQTIKLWDLRMMHPADSLSPADLPSLDDDRWDYRDLIFRGRRGQLCLQARSVAL